MVQHLVDRGRKEKRCMAATCLAGLPAVSSGAHRCLVKPEGPRGGGNVTGLHLCGSKGPTGGKGKT